MTIDLICPGCKGELLRKEELMLCAKCGDGYSLIKGIPVLLASDNEVFSYSTCADATSSGFNFGICAAISKYLPDLTLNRFQDKALAKFINTLARGSNCLILGVGNDNILKEKLLAKKLNVKATDVFISNVVDYVCDVTTLPFANSQFDAVFIIAVLEHVIDPIKAVQEISRVLKTNGRVFSAIPFMQQVHMGCFDFQRYTLLGHRWLYSSFELIELAPTSGAGSALLWSISSFFQSFFKQKKVNLLIKAIIRLFLFWIKYFDLLQQNCSNFALGSYFVGVNKKRRVISSRHLIELYPYVS